MKFTDDDLKRVKQKVAEPLYDHTYIGYVKVGEIRALLARLEAAERFISVGSAHPMSKTFYEAWRKAAGKI